MWRYRGAQRHVPQARPLGAAAHAGSRSRGWGRKEKIKNARLHMCSTVPFLPAAKINFSVLVSAETHTDQIYHRSTVVLRCDDSIEDLPSLYSAT
jgi:hypothetical protein